MKMKSKDGVSLSADRTASAAKHSENMKKFKRTAFILLFFAAKHQNISFNNQAAFCILPAAVWFRH